MTACCTDGAVRSDGYVFAPVTIARLLTLGTDVPSVCQSDGRVSTSLFVGGLAGQALRRLEIEGDTVTGQEVIFDQFGRVRDVVQGPDGYLYLALQHATGAGPATASSLRRPGSSSG
jgi:hypothetical protein